MSAPEAIRSGFWNRPATWKAFLLIAGYLAFYLAVGRVVGRLSGDRIDTQDPLSTPESIFFAFVLPVGIGGLALLVFTWRVGWLGDVFGRQPVRGRSWMWLGPVLVLAAIAGHVGSTDWSGWSAGQIAMIALAGVCIGLTEELATRGLAVRILRGSGRGEQSVAVISSLLFALMHSANLLTGMAVSTVGATIVYTFGFGMCMYLAMRVTGSFWAAVALHALTDPTTFLSSGGVDRGVDIAFTDSVAGWAVLSIAATVALIAFGIIAAFLVRGKATRGTTPQPATA